MTIRVGEVGKKFRYSTGGFDLSSSTGLELTFTKPDGTTLVKDEASSNPVTAPAVALTAVDDPDIGPVSASTYLEFTTISTDFDQAGTWSVCAEYSDATPKIYYGSTVTFTVSEAC